MKIAFPATWLIVAKKEIQEAFRSKLFFCLAVIIWGLLIFAALGGYKAYSNIRQQQNEAEKMFREELAEKDRNPHSAAHFGTWLYKPLTILSLFDPGVNDYTGSTYRVEAHKQSEMNFAAAKDSDSMMRFGSLSIATVLQLFLPLLIVFLCSASISKEYERGMLKLLYTQGATKKAILWGKITGNFSLILIIIFPALILTLIAGAFNGIIPRVSLFIFSYFIYLFVWTGVSVLISDWVRSSGSSLLLQLCLWIFFCIISPKIIASTANERYPLLSYYEFSKLVNKDFYNGINGDPSYAQRRENLEKNTLKKYKVDSIPQLPINIDGLMLQDAEDYMARSYSLHSLTIDSQLVKQQNTFKYGAFISPYISIKELSRAFAGTDLFHHQDFHHKAGTYRNEFVRTLNNALVHSDPKEEKHLVSANFLAGIKPFIYHIQGSAILPAYLIPIGISLLCWLGLILLLIELSVIKIRK
ncbi:ABC transporter permease subunit [uncultured Pedobacter sp.]|uniref:ABC transporter permease subunit n=1 Tax=uncultured Pedobacter sp. TaxID=246139 RepID=UPI0025EC2342|nr:ABC transporter permease subunit [uncultured Pedobacter sp.]